MSQYKFKVDQPEPSDEQINRHKDFKKLHANYERMTKPLYKTPLYKNPKVLITLLLILIIAWLVAEYGEELLEKKTPGDSVPAQQVKPESP